MVDEAVSERVRDDSTTRASSATTTYVTSAETESAASDSEAASPPSSSPASPTSVIAADESPMDTSAPSQPLPSSAAQKRPLSDNSSPSGDETTVPSHTPSDSEGGFLEVASRKKKNKKKRRNTKVVASSSPAPGPTPAAIASLMDVVVASPIATKTPQASFQASQAPKAKKPSTCSAQPAPRQAVPPIFLRDSLQ
ncbi:hypothetical protein ACJJTC_017300 [Scirpophaga incertulas]